MNPNLEMYQPSQIDIPPTTIGIICSALLTNRVP